MAHPLVKVSIYILSFSGKAVMQAADAEFTAGAPLFVQLIAIRRQGYGVSTEPEDIGVCGENSHYLAACGLDVT